MVPGSIKNSHNQWLMYGSSIIILYALRISIVTGVPQ